MTKIAEKLKSQSGASMIISLIFFLTAFMVGTVVLSSATANSDKLIARREERQRYFALSSAARFLRSTIEGTKGEVWDEETTYYCATSHLDIIDRDGNRRHSNTTAHSPDMAVTNSDTKVQKLLAETAFKMHENLRVNSAAPPIEAELTLEIAEMEPVDVVITMENTYNLLITLKMRGKEEAMTMTVPASKTPKPSNVKTECNHTYNTVVVNTDGTSETKEVNGNFDINTNRKTLEVAWSTAIITKGVVTT